MAIKKHLTIVIKLGTSSLCDEKTQESRIANMSSIVEATVQLRRQGHKVIIVSSGGIAVGLKRMGLPRRPKHLSSVQAVAAIGQARLIGLWDDLFRQLDQPVAQILLTRNDISDRTQYLNAANTLNELLSMGVIPIVNENDTLSVYEIRFGDNDTLSAITAGMVNADYLFLMTDVDCLYTANPRTHPEAEPILVVRDIAKLKADVSSPGSSVGTGGMTTKLIAAELATSAGVTTIICRSSVPGNINSIVNHLSESELLLNKEEKTTVDSETDDEATKENSRKADQLLLDSLRENSVPLHTCFIPRGQPIKDRKFWILHGLTTHGSVFIDPGAYRAVTRSNKAGLLPVGVVQVDGTFHTSECVKIFVVKRLKDTNGNNSETEPILIGKALVNYTSVEIDRIKGLHSEDIEGVLSYADSEYVAFRDNMAFYNGMKALELQS